MSKRKSAKHLKVESFCGGWTYRKIRSMVSDNVRKYHPYCRNEDIISDIVSDVVGDMLERNVKNADDVFKIVGKYGARYGKRLKSEISVSQFFNEGFDGGHSEMFDTFGAQRERCKPQQENILFWKQCAAAALGIDDDLLDLIVDFANPADFAKELNMPLPLALARYRRFCGRMKERVAHTPASSKGRTPDFGSGNRGSNP